MSPRPPAAPPAHRPATGCARVLGAALALAACDPQDATTLDAGVGVDAPPDDAPPDAPPFVPVDPAWTDVGLGVAYRRMTTGDGVLIAYGGYTTQLTDSEAWATALVAARLATAGIGHAYAVQGPADPGYTGLEIANTALRAHLAGAAPGAASIYVIAHSSGAYVAHELLGQLARAGDAATLARTGYANLDGDGAGFTAERAAALRALAFVYADDPTLAAGLSHNAAAMLALGATYAPAGVAVEVTVPGSGCDDGASWCLHDLVITQRPHDPTSYDLARDYTDFVGRPVTTSYLDALGAP